MRNYKLIKRMKRHAAKLSLALLILQVSCVAQQGGGNTMSDSYSEDLTLARPKFEPETIDSTKGEEVLVKQTSPIVPTHTVNKKVDYVMDSLDKLNMHRKFVDGYTIQIYSGANREEALGAKAKMTKSIDNIEAYVQYSQPKFTVTVGRYFSQLEAQKDLMRLRNYFSNAILIPEKIPIK